MNIAARRTASFGIVSARVHLSRLSSLRSLLLPLLLLVLSRLLPLKSSSEGLRRLAVAVSTRFLGGDLSFLRGAGDALRERGCEREREADRERLPEDELGRDWELLELEEPDSDPELEL